METVVIILLSIALSVGLLVFALLLAVYQTFDHPRETLRGFFNEDFPKAPVQKQSEPELKGVNIVV